MTATGATGATDATDARRSIALNTAWRERHLGGSPEKEAELLRLFVEQIRQVQERNRGRDGGPIRRAFHAAALAGVGNARFKVAHDVRPELRQGLFVPGATYPAVVRFSNASGMHGLDRQKDLRGIAIRVRAGGEVQDFLMTNAPASHARDPRQFMAAAVAMAGGRRLAAVPRLVRDLGLREALRMLRSLRRASSRPVHSLATEAFWSRAPFAVGPCAVRFKLQPLAALAAADSRKHPSLRDELVDRLRKGDVRFHLQVQHFVDERSTPIEDGSVEWTERVAPPETVAELVIPRQDLVDDESLEAEREVETLAFSPWNSTPGVRPIGALNRARKPVYRASVQHRGLGS